MSKGINRCEFLGNLVRDSETKFAPSGTAVTKFTIAVNDRVKQGDQWVDQAEFVNCVMFKGENVANYMTKGCQVLVTGKMQTRKYEKDGEARYSTEILVFPSDIVLLGSKSDRSTGGSAGAGPQRVPASAPVDESDLPF